MTTTKPHATAVPKGIVTMTVVVRADTRSKAVCANPIADRGGPVTDPVTTMNRAIDSAVNITAIAGETATLAAVARQA